MWNGYDLKIYKHSNIEIQDWLKKNVSIVYTDIADAKRSNNNGCMRCY